MERPQDHTLVDLRRDFVEHAKLDAENFSATRTSIEEFKALFQEYVRSDIEWKKEDARYKEDNQEALLNMKNLSGGFKLFLKFCLAVSMIGGAIFTVKKIINL